MVQTPLKKISLQDFLQQPDTKPASEYIDGEIIQKPMPKTNHSRLQAKLAAKIDLALEEKKIAIALTEQRCVFAGRAIVPDITVLPWHNIPRRADGIMEDEDLLMAPPWMIEILSKGQSQTKVTKKMFHALSSGSEMGWLIDPKERCVFVYKPGLLAALYESAEQTLPVPDFATGFSLTIGQMFSWLRV